MTRSIFSRMLPLVFLGSGLILLAVAVYYLLQQLPDQNADLSAVPAQVNYSVPELSLIDAQGQTHSLADFHGQVVLVNLWATWCPPCKAEMPALQAFYDQHRDEGFTVLAINDGDPTPAVMQFIKDYRLTFPVWLDPTYQATDHAFKTLNLPSSFVIDRSGTIRLSWVGGISRKMLDQYVPQLIEEQQ